MPLNWKMTTDFPFSKVFILGVILALLGLASMIISIIAFVIQSWGHYAGTGMWGGAIILASGLTAVFVSQLKSLASVKTFFVFSVIAMFTSLIMLILSAGGLTLSSGFYSHIGSTDYNKRASNLIHASLLVNSVFCLTGSILAMIICCKYLVFEHHDKQKCQHRNRNILFGTVRTQNTGRGVVLSSSSNRTMNSRTSLPTIGASHRHSDNVGNGVQIEYRRCHQIHTHKHSSDQPHSNPQFRRQRHSHPDSRSNNTNLLSPCGVHYYPDRRNRNRSSSQGREVRGENKERDRLNIVPPIQISGTQFSQVQIQTRLSRNLNTTSPKVHLPTEFDEEELPPYESLESTANAISGSHSDSGDESDTENSSSTDTQSCIAAVLDEERTDTVPVIEIQSNHIPENDRIIEQHKTTNFKSFSEHHSKSTSAIRLPSDGLHNSERQILSVLSPSDRKECVTNVASCNSDAVTVEQDQWSSNRLVLNYLSTLPHNPKDCKYKLSISPEVCAVKGDSLSVPQKEVQENFYENGPCYENVKCVGINNKENLNHLSKPSSSCLTKTHINVTSEIEEDTEVKSSIPVNNVVDSSSVSDTSQQLPQSIFSSTISAFRPVCTTISALSPNDICLADTMSSSFHPSGDGNSHHATCEVQNSSPHIYVNAHMPKKCNDSILNSTSKYVEQGAVPKTVKLKGDLFEGSNRNVSRNNIHLPSSYNHFESASNESEKKLPSKKIPFTDLKVEIPCASLQKEVPTRIDMSSKLSSHVNPTKNLMSSSVPSSSVLAIKSLALPATLFGAGIEAVHAIPAKLNNNSVCEIADTQHHRVPISSAFMLSDITVSSVREASTQVNSVSTSRWPSRRMGGNQSLLQNRREEIHNSQICHRTVETSARTVRPSSMPMSGGFSGICHGISGLATDRQSRNRSNETASTNSTDTTNPQPSISHLASHPEQQAQSLVLRQNHLLQHYPLQPQQPRLGVQLHQRRQQQHQLQQNIESQQQHQQMQQQQLQQQRPQGGNQQNLHGRNGRPLFSVLL